MIPKHTLHEDIRAFLYTIQLFFTKNIAFLLRLLYNIKPQL